jgi:tryptophan 2,3-dioxygenase
MGGELIAFEHPEKDLLFELEPNLYRCLPHKTPGEGLFFCIIRKPDGLFEARNRETSPKKKNKKTISVSMEFDGFQSLTKGEERNLQRFKDVCFGENPIEGRRLSPSANRAALFIMLYREFPLLQMPYQLLNTLLDIDELMATWRFRHVNMVHRIIGTRVGTGGSTGKDYLLAALNKHYIFKELAELTSFLVQRNSLPELDPELKDALCFRGNNH